MIHAAGGRIFWLADLTDAFVVTRYLYDLNNPWAVTFRFTVEGQVAHRHFEYQFSRTLLAVGLTYGRWVGDGDVSLIRPTADALVFELAGDATVTTQPIVAERFLAETYRLVPLGSEHVDWDGVTGRIFEEEAAS